MSDQGYSRITIKVRDEWCFRETVKIAADSKSESVNGFMIRAIRDAVRKCGVDFPVPILNEEKQTANHNP